MNCSRDLIEAYMDEELDPGRVASLEEHLSGCSSCSEAYSRFRAQKANIRSIAPYYTAPLQLQQAVRKALRQAAADDAQPVTRFSFAAGSSGGSPPWRWLAIAATVLLAVSVSWNILPSSRLGPDADPLAENIVSDHIRSLIGTHLLDVPSSNQHTVKPWFNGKLDFSPEVKDFASQGFPLIGGRLEYLMDRPVAALVYQRRQHIINVFTWPAASTAKMERPFARNGYVALHWNHGSMTFWAVSDISSVELSQFESLYEK
jgi:anti-sigma factor RsiW